MRFIYLLENKIFLENFASYIFLEVEIERIFHVSNQWDYDSYNIAGGFHAQTTFSKVKRIKNGRPICESCLPLRSWTHIL